MEVNFIQEEINIHKTKLMSLINNFISTQLINEEIFINNEIKKESECLISLLNVKQKELLNQMNNNINLNPFIFQPNNLMNIPPMNINQMNIGQPQININKLNIMFEREFDTPRTIVIEAQNNETVSNIIKKYQEKSNDNNDNFYLWNLKDLNNYMNYTLSDLKLKNQNKIQVSRKCCVMAGKLESLFNCKSIN